MHSNFSSPNHIGSRSIVWTSFLVLITLSTLVQAAHADIDLPPINYSKTDPVNCISDLQAKIDKGKTKLVFDEDHGYLKSVLEALQIPLSSQMLVFSKTSLQRHRISPKTPRAIYYNDDVYLGFCKNGDVLEISVADPQLGTVYYTLDQVSTAKPQFTRQTDNCLICHASSANLGYPGHLVRSVFTEWDGHPALGLGSVRVTHTTPLAQRYGGWYVTGTSGKQQHRGNLFLKNRFDPAPADNKEGVNVTDLRKKFFVGDYLTPHSDLVALMVLEHQAEMHNRIVRASFETRLAMYQQAEFDKILNRQSDGPSETTKSRIKSACEPLVEYMLFSKEAELTEKIAGTSSFAKDFAAIGPKDKKGRSLRDFDLEKRLFKYPCSFLIYSDSFAKLPGAARDYIYERLWTILSDGDSSRYDHLTADDRQATLEILTATVKDLPDYWKKK